MKQITLCIMLMLPVLSVSAAEQEKYDFKLSVVEEADGGDVEIYTPFSITEGEYGGAEIIFYYDKYSYSIRAIENVRDMVSMIKDEDIRFRSSNIMMVIKLFMTPTMTESNDIRLTGVMKVMNNTRRSGEPLYKYSEEELDFTIPDNGEKLIKHESESSGRSVQLLLSVKSPELKRYIVEKKDITFLASYSLFNESENRYEIKDEICDLSFKKDLKKDKIICRHSKTFAMPKGDSLLYMVIYRIDNAGVYEDGSVNLTFTAERNYFLNPKVYYQELARVDDKNADYGGGRRSIESTTKIDGKAHKVEAEIEDGTVIFFKWDNIILDNQDIVRNWHDIVTILNNIDDGEYAYKPPRIESFDSTKEPKLKDGILKTPGNYTGDKITSTAYSRSITVDYGEKIEIEIPFTKESALPFKAKETITLSNEDAFVPVDDIPELLYEAIPIYPEGAIESKTEGTVWIKAYVDKEGIVRKAEAVKCNRPGYGFEEAALEAAYKNKYQPGIRGEKPVALWVTYSVEFTLGL